MGPADPATVAAIDRAGEWGRAAGRAVVRHLDRQVYAELLRVGDPPRHHCQDHTRTVEVVRARERAAAAERRELWLAWWGLVLAVVFVAAVVIAVRLVDSRIPTSVGAGASVLPGVGNVEDTGPRFFHLSPLPDYRRVPWQP